MHVHIRTSWSEVAIQDWLDQVGISIFALCPVSCRRRGRINEWERQGQK